MRVFGDGRIYGTFEDRVMARIWERAKRTYAARKGVGGK